MIMDMERTGRGVDCIYRLSGFDAAFGSAQLPRFRYVVFE